MTLPDLLKGSTLFQLPYEHIKNLTVFTITTRDPSDIYIAQQEGTKRGWNESRLVGNGWDKVIGSSVVVKHPANSPSIAELSKIWHIKTNGRPSSVKLPSIETPLTVAAIFVVEGKVQSM